MTLVLADNAIKSACWYELYDYSFDLAEPGSFTGSAARDRGFIGLRAPRAATLPEVARRPDPRIVTCDGARIFLTDERNPDLPTLKSPAIVHHSW
jgi:hypothetical protein